MENKTTNFNENEVTMNEDQRTIDSFQKEIEAAALLVLSCNIRQRNTTISDLNLVKVVFSSMKKRNSTADEFYNQSKALLDILELLAKGLVNNSRPNVDSMIVLVETSSEIVSVLKSKGAWLAGVTDQVKKESAASNDASIVKNDLDKLDDNTPYTIVYE